jgi:amidase
MNPDEYARYDGLGLADLIRRKEVTAKEVVLAAMEGFQKVNLVLNAVIEVYADRIETVDRLLEPDRPFSGVPFLLKDLGAAEAGQRQEMGSRLAKGYVAQQDAYLTKRFRNAGLAILGRTATPELGLAATTESVLAGTTGNPWDSNLMAGGSSGGAAAAVAAGIVPVAHASDGGGSIRIPAACCGVVGMKPSRGRVSCGPNSDEMIFGLAQEFVISRTVRDTAAMLDAVSQPAPGDPYVVVQPRRSFLKEIGAPTGKLNIALISESWAGVEVNKEITDSVKQVARICEAMGHTIEEAMPRFGLDAYFSALGVMWNASLGYTIDQLALKMNRPVDEEHLEPVTLAVYRQSRDISAAEVIRARSALNTVRRDIGAFHHKYDLLLTPTTAQLPVPINTLSQNLDIPLEEWYQRTSQFNTFTNLFNATGLPAISLPLCQGSGGLPIGIQFTARFGEEALLLRIASAFEEAMPWKDRLPHVHVSR